MKSLRHKAFAATSAAALFAGMAVTAGFAAPAAAAGPDTTYLVLAPGNSTNQAAKRVAAANGTVVADYGQIGVLVVRSTNPSFSTQVKGGGVQSVASTEGLGAQLDEGETVEVDAAARRRPPVTRRPSRCTPSSGTWTRSTSRRRTR